MEVHLTPCPCLPIMAIIIILSGVSFIDLPWRYILSCDYGILALTTTTQISRNTYLSRECHFGTLFMEQAVIVYVC